MIDLDHNFLSLAAYFGQRSEKVKDAIDAGVACVEDVDGRSPLQFAYELNDYYTLSVLIGHLSSKNELVHLSRGDSTYLIDHF